MLEALILSRFLVDFFWELKALSIAHTLLFVPVLMVLGHRAVRQDGFRLSTLDVMALVFFGCMTVPFLSRPSEEGLIQLAKMGAYLVFYLLGRVTTSYFPYRRRQAVVCLACLGLMLAAALGNVGYKEWGSAITFAGGYFFKTDAALAAVLFTLFVVAGLPGRGPLVAAGLAGAYLVYMTNARIAMPLALVVPWMVWKFAGEPRRDIERTKWHRQVLMVAVLLAVALYLLVSRGDDGALGLDLDDVFSEENTQGRSVIWLALWNAFQDYSLMEQLFGGGLDADVIATTQYSSNEDLAGVHAHGTLPYLLICTGLLGTFAFAAMLWASLRSGVFVLRNGDSASRRVAAMYLALLVIFSWISLTVEAIIRAQICVPMFLLMGMVSRDAVLLRRLSTARYLATAHGNTVSAPAIVSGQVFDLSALGVHGERRAEAPSRTPVPVSGSAQMVAVVDRPRRPPNVASDIGPMDQFKAAHDDSQARH